MRIGLLVVAGLLIAGCVSAAAPNWLSQIGVNGNNYPGGSNDDFNYFGAYTDSIDNYPDMWDVVDPGYPDHAVSLIFRGDQNGNNPTYPANGLSWDIRAPYETDYKVWKIDAVLPDAGYTYDLVYDFDPFGGYGLPQGWICKLDMNGEINANNYKDLSLYEVNLDNLQGKVLTGLPQTGGIQTWYVVAGIPEPPLVQLAGLLLGIAGIGLARLRK
jgi:hypothetical protein